MLLDFLDALFNVRGNLDNYRNDEPQDIEDAHKKQVLKIYEANKMIEKETNPERKKKMQHLLSYGVTDFSNI